jgi:hypothetical protein
VSVRGEEKEGEGGGGAISPPHLISQQQFGMTYFVSALRCLRLLI